MRTLFLHQKYFNKECYYEKEIENCMLYRDFDCIGNICVDRMYIQQLREKPGWLLHTF